MGFGGGGEAALPLGLVLARACAVVAVVAGAVLCLSLCHVGLVLRGTLSGLGLCGCRAHGRCCALWGVVMLYLARCCAAVRVRCFALLLYEYGAVLLYEYGAVLCGALQLPGVVPYCVKGRYCSQETTQ